MPDDDEFQEWWKRVYKERPAAYQIDDILMRALLRSSKKVDDGKLKEQGKENGRSDQN